MYNCHDELFSASHMLIVEREGNLIDGMLKQVQYGLEAYRCSVLSGCNNLQNT